MSIVRTAPEQHKCDVPMRETVWHPPGFGPLCYVTAIFPEATHLVPEGATGDLWRCDECRKLWRVGDACDMWRPAHVWQCIRYWRRGR
jgi:hypothetical protein